MTRYLVVLPIALTVLATGSVSAHHSFAATYVEDRTVRIEGDLVQFSFRNPHSFMHIEVREANGRIARYAVEWGGAGELGTRGVTKETLKAGDYVIISGTPARDPKDHRVRLVSLLRPRDGFGWGPLRTGKAD